MDGRLLRLRAPLSPDATDDIGLSNAPTTGG
jgi:hypothetical protein